MLFLRLFWEFFKTGLFAVGGGLATLPFLADMADRTGWFTRTQLMDMVAVAESTPGPIGVNTATYVGFTSAGILGSLVATLGLVTPSVIIILIIAGFLKNFGQNRFVISVFRYLRPTSVALICAAGLTVAVETFWIAGQAGFLASVDWRALALGAVIFIFSQCVKKTSKWHPIIYIGISAAVGLLLF